ncbi:MAG: tyrosine-type recombinase/integrase [Rhodospirillales bacterium]|nr:tyrosine-type recombinase/integrase [Rhodospirillales bacterium]
MNSSAHATGGPRKAKPRGRHPDKALTTAFVRTAGPGRYWDGQGLYLFVQPSGTRSWVQRLVVRGRRQEIGLGSAALVPLAEARENAIANRKLAREGGDPLAEKRRAERTPTFAAAAVRVLEQKRAGWQSSRHAQSWLTSLERYAFPRIGTRLVSEVTGADVLEVLTPIWHQKTQTARRVRQRIRAVLEWAVAMELRLDNPCDRVGPVLGPQSAMVEHRRALPHQDIAAAIAKVRVCEADPIVKLALEFLVLTAARWGEVRGAEWAEIRTASRVWNIPAVRMKAKRAHRIPLSRRATQILDAARIHGDGSSALVFPATAGAPLPEKVLRRLLQAQNIPAVPHGFRSTFRDWAAEQTNHPREVVEAALAHMVTNQVEAAYARSDLFERRRQLMDEWSAAVCGHR